MNYNWIKKQYERFGYKFYTKELSLNIFGFRANNSTPNSFDDMIGVAYVNSEGEEILETYQATTDPGLTVLGEKFGGSIGTLILPPGQHFKLFRVGKHKGKYTALVQNRDVEVIRDYNKDDMLDFDSSRRQTGMFGLNLHHANSNWDSTEVNNWSHGCQTIRKFDDWVEFIQLVLDSADLYGKVFTYTLFEEREMGSLNLESYFK